MYNIYVELSAKSMAGIGNFFPTLPKKKRQKRQKRQKGKKAKRQKDKKTKRQKDIKTKRQKSKKIKYKKANRQRDIETKRRKDKKTNRQKHICQSPILLGHLLCPTFSLQLQCLSFQRSFSLSQICSPLCLRQKECHSFYFYQLLLCFKRLIAF